METDAMTPPTVDGWNLDEDPANNPTYPMRDVSADRAKGVEWPQPPLQEPSVEVLQSVEHVRRPAVFGTSIPPSGLSGVIRRLAFKRSESDWWHWLLLIGADRINVVEGVIDDLGKGRIPDIFAEKGMRAELKYNKPAFVRKTATLAVAALAGALIINRRSASRRRKSRATPYRAR